MELLPKEQVRQGSVTDEEVEQFIKEQCSYIKATGSMPLHDLQCIANNFHVSDKVRIRIFQCLEFANDRQRNWEQWKAEKERQLGRQLTTQEVWNAHSPAKIKQEEIDELTSHEKNRDGKGEQY